MSSNKIHDEVISSPCWTEMYDFQMDGNCSIGAARSTASFFNTVFKRASPIIRTKSRQSAERQLRTWGDLGLVSESLDVGQPIL